MGWTDVPIDDAGWDEAKAAAEKTELQSMGIDALFCSQMTRCVQTAEVFESALGIESKIVPGLEERGWGPFEGKQKSNRNRASDISGVEALAEFRERISRTLDWIAEQAGSPLVVTHSGVIRAAFHECGRVPKERIPHLIPFVMAWPPDRNA